MSAEWGHRLSGERLFNGGVEFCAECTGSWPCDAEKMRVERDAAIRRASEIDVETLVTAFDRAGWHLNGEDYDIVVKAAAEYAVLRSQESQKPPETEDRDV